ncbi:HesB/YadR/YfhF family protein [Metabacillus fastidiosus]|uniref:HesB/YadR/YfhF family protein n=1 Tax=Metabacillus fastidiosus TaxID=1458 RepID=UPI003D26E435
MNLEVHRKAADWYINELQLNKGDFVKFFVRYGGCSNIQKGFSLGVMKQAPEEIGTSDEAEGVTFYIEGRDLWYFDQYDLAVYLDEKNNEPLFDYISAT